MALTLAEKAARITCVACAVATDKVRILSFEPFAVDPKNLMDVTFDSVNISGPAQVDTFKKAAAELLPPNQKGRKAIQASILAQAIDTRKKVRLFRDFLTALLAEQEVI